MYIIPPHGATERKGFTSASCSRDSQARLTHSSASYSIMWTLWLDYNLCHRGRRTAYLVVLSTCHIPHMIGIHENVWYVWCMPWTRNVKSLRRVTSNPIHPIYRVVKSVAYINAYVVHTTVTCKYKFTAFNALHQQPGRSNRATCMCQTQQE